MVLAGSGSVVGLACLVLLAPLLAGCGEGSSQGPASASTHSTVPISPAAAATPTQNTAAAAASTGVSVAGQSIAKTSYQHWVSVEKALGQTTKARHQALGFLITSEWVLREAAEMHITVSEAEVKQRYSALVSKSFPKPGALQKFFATSGESEADILARIRVELLASKIAAKVTAGKKGAARAAALRAFEKRFQQRWKSLTNCKSGYVMEDCKQYKGSSENLTATAPASSSTTNSASSSNGEVYTRPGGFSLSSPEFERNEQIPVQYTCAGKGISPALSWEKVPAGAAELFLFVIDDSSGNKEGGGQRWIVGGIDPGSKGVEAGKLPPGGIVGTNTAGKAGYSPICPEKGKSDTIEFVMYALKKRIKISPGFNPTEAESQYGSGKLAIGEAAVTYGIASR
ncbi:MAG: hypothetical protein ACRDK2_06830 [Solirubrobacteraceae bacterium]